MSGHTYWITGLSGSGKSTFAQKLARTNGGIVLDADDLRKGLNVDLGFNYWDRAENVRRIGEVALILAKAGHTAIAVAISPDAEHRNLVRRQHEKAGMPFTEVYISTPIEVCESRDTKGLYAKARAGVISDFAGISLKYDVPTSPEVTI